MVSLVYGAFCICCLLRMMPLVHDLWVEDVLLLGVIPGIGFSMGGSDLCLAEACGHNGTSGSEGVPRKVSSHRSGKTSVDDAIGFVFIARPEVSMEQRDLSMGGSWRKQGGQWK